MVVIRIFLFCVLFGTHLIYPLTYIFSHGLGASSALALRYTKESSLEDLIFSKGWCCQAGDKKYRPEVAMRIAGKPLITVQYPHDRKDPFEGGRIRNAGIDLNAVSCAQDYEIEALREAVLLAQDDVIIIGHSMGAATVLTYLATYGCERVKAIILEAPFDCIDSAVDHKCSIFAWTGIGKIARKILFSAYNPEGITPLKSIATIRSQHVPILFIHSTQDGIVPYECSVRLYNALKDAGRDNVHLLTVHNASHNNIMFTDGALYEAAAHAFYKRYNLPYDNDLAQLGEALLK